MLKMENELINLSINYKGEDIMVSVDMETANILLNDPEQLNLYCEDVFGTTSALTSTKELCTDTSSESENVKTTQNTECGEDNSVEKIWTKKISTETDVEATEAFLGLRQKYASKFDDRKTSKILLWGIIARELNEKGYFVGEGRDGAEKCRQKFSNMQKIYVNHVRHMHKTGEEKKETPPFFEKLHSILGEKDKINPKNLQDTQELILSCDKENVCKYLSKNIF